MKLVEIDESVSNKYEFVVRAFCYQKSGEWFETFNA